ncbi:hypothetical protein DY052_05910 [Apilactobacillus timberlakei]|uniref:ATPase, T2SS/T4P/T4SS family n=1 Tax=Apilactobacillus timberlakei TaxID=2008380 RepID=UPI00112941FD|nr:ATPase, T2SS/T4P/T4SS family [Apilactobacillus timberlakei]TPR14958.1 hypothetical protein DY052_05910 [Apilactobacillus timberlakei]
MGIFKKRKKKNEKQLNNVDPNEFSEKDFEEDFEEVKENNEEVAVESTGVSKNEISEIEDIITNLYNRLALDAFRNPKKEIRDQAHNELVDILTNHKDFANFKTHGNKEISESVAQEITGLGVIGEILTNNPSLTDLDFDGRHLVMVSRKGTSYYNGKDVDGKNLVNNDVALRFVNIFAKILKKSFNENNPTLNGSMGDLRISATDGSLTADGNVTFSIRISKNKLVLNEKNFSDFAPIGIYHVLDNLVKAGANIILCGGTGVGKSQVQKLLCKSIPDKKKIVMIEDVPETRLYKLYPNKNVVNWITKEKNQLASSRNSGGLEVTMSDHIKQGLRFTPNWLIVSETRGEEAFDMQEGAKSGHSIMTTMHTNSNNMVASRFVSMIMRAIKNLDVKRARLEFLETMHVGLHLSKKVINGSTYRYLDELSVFVPESDEHPFGTIPIYQAKLHNDLTRTCKTFEMPDKITELISKELDNDDLVGDLMKKYYIDFSSNGSEFEDKVSEI